MPKQIMLLHGMNTDETSNWARSWKEAIEEMIGSAQFVNCTVHDIEYNEEFELGGNLESDIQKLIHASIDNNQDDLIKVASYLKSQISTIKPKLIIAHSLGSLLLFFMLSNYRALFNEDLPPNIYKNLVLITFGSQIPNIHVYNSVVKKADSRFQWYFDPTGKIKNWFNLYNAQDTMLEPIGSFWVRAFNSRKGTSGYNENFLDFDSSIENFEEVSMSFSNDHHSPYNYLTHINTKRIWKIAL